jgi:acyl-CoA thioesterase-1
MGRVIAVIATATAAVVTLAAGSASAAAFPVIVPRTTNASSQGTFVVGIGDSILEGHGLAPDQAWLAVLAERQGWRLTNLASDGSGFVTEGDNSDTFADQAETAIDLRPDVIVISGSSNDLGTDAATIATATSATIAKIHAALPGTKIITVSAVWGDTTLPPQLNSITADVAVAAAAAGASYLDIGQPLSGRPALMQSDDVHPTAKGQRILAAAVGRAMRSDQVTA